MYKFDNMSREEIIDYLEEEWNQLDYTKQGDDIWWKTVELGHAINKVLGNDPDYELDDSDPDEGMYDALDDDQLVEVAEILETVRTPENEYTVSLTLNELQLVKELIENATDPA